MAQIEKKDIVAFIAQLYKEKRNEVAPPELLNKWENLSQEDINTNLSTLFQRWNMSDTELQVAIQRFYNQRSAASNTSSLNNTSYSATSSATAGPNINQNNNKNPYPPSKPYPTTKKGISPIVWLLLLALLGGMAYLGYQYIVYKNLSELYAITDNISIRNKDGKISGRMDLYANKENGSVSKLRTLSSEVYYLKHENEDKEYPTRKVLLDSTGFFDYLLKKDEVTYFVNTNFVVNNKEEFELYQKTFKEINTVPDDNKRLTSLQRKIIVGSIARVSNLSNNYLVSNSQGLNNAAIKSTLPFLIQEIRPAQHFVIIAAMNDGNYYRFEGDIKLNEFVKPEPIKLLTSSGQPLLQGAFRFQKNGDIWKLYDVTNKKSTYYEARKDALGKYIAFELNEPVSVPVVDTNTLIAPEDLFNQ